MLGSGDYLTGFIVKLVVIGVCLVLAGLVVGAWLF